MLSASGLFAHEILSMTYKYSVTLAILGSHKLSRFKAWADAHMPELDYNLPPQTPIKTETMTIRLRSLEDRQTLLQNISRRSLDGSEK
ncbi:hypothetical protein [Devosia sp. MC1541]|uniref:hypothetical protein n=1 Tax=Devosia sp. MC1541 TaxID=2725264 RepID=UPI0020C00C08|nr:hypothetical protein [Devosia sp. MC1541]